MLISEHQAFVFHYYGRELGPQEGKNALWEGDFFVS